MSVQAKAKLSELESFFQRFPDMPKEVILKEDILRLGFRFSEQALQRAEGCRTKQYYIFSLDRLKVDAMAKKESLRAPEDVKFTGGPYALRPTVAGVRISPDSPYLIDMADDKVVLRLQGEVMAEVEYPKQPDYYTRTFEDGVAYREIAALVNWGDKAFVTILRNCQYWGDQEECKFCDLNSNVRQQKNSGRPYTVHKSVERVAEVLETIFKKDRWPETHSYIITGGTITDQVKGKKDEDFYLEYIEAIKERIGNRWACVLQTAAKDKETCKRLRAAGVDAHHANFEVWDKRLFQILCPGKEGFVGRDEWIRRLVESVEVFGEGGVTPTFVAGVEMCKPYGFATVDEAIKSTGEGLDFLMSHGVVPRVTNWCVEPLSALAGQDPPPLEYNVRLLRCWHETWKKYGLPPPRGQCQMGPGISTNDNSAYLDMGG